MTESQSQSFTKVAEFYDELMRPVPYRMWVSYYLLLLSMQEVKPKTMLDMCCGTGTMSEFMTREGFEVEGFDLSAEMIEIARQKAAKKKMSIRFEVADAATVDMGRKYDSVFSFFDSFNNIIAKEQLQKAFQSGYNHLVPGGSFIFDMNTAYAFEENLFNQQDMAKTSRVRYRWRGDWNPKTRLIHVTMKFWIGDQAFEEIHIQRAYGLEETIEMLMEAGFEEIRFFHSYTLQPSREKSDRIHFCAIRPK